MRTTEIMDEALRLAQLPSDYALAARLGTSRQVVSKWRQGGTPDPLYCYRLGELAGLDPLEVIGWIELEKAEKANKGSTAEAWRVILTKTATAAKEYRDKATGAVVTGFMVGTLLLAPPPANASSNSPLKTDSQQEGSLYIMSTQRRRKERRKRGAMAAMARTLAGFSKHRLN